MTTPVKASQSRVFFIEGGAGPTNEPDYKGCMRIGALGRGYGDNSPIEIPDPAQYDSFVEAGEVAGATERPSSSLETRFDRKMLSELMALAERKCAFDIQLHIGACSDPRVFNTYDKIVVLEGARISNYSTEDLGALESSQNAAVNESADISSKSMYELVPLGVGQEGGSVITNEAVDIVLCDTVTCGECEDASTGCNKVFAITLGAGGSPSTPADVVFTLDGGITWLAHDVDSLDAAENPTGIACVGEYIIVVSNDSVSLHYALKSEFNAYTDPAFTEVGIGFVTDHGPNDIWSVGQLAFIVGDGGYVYKMESDPSAGATVLDAGGATTAQLNAVHAISEDFAVAVGNNGAVIYTTNGISWQQSPASPVGYGTNLNCVWVVNENTWWVGDSNGYLWFTKNAGVTWTEKGFTGNHAGQVYDICFSTPTVGYLSHATAAPSGRTLRTVDGGHSWKALPDKVGNMPANDRINALAVCPSNANVFFGAGLADDGADGILVIGSS